MLAYIAPIVVFGLVIFVHELGHFLAAKLVGVYAPRFSIGFGPALFRRRRGETEYVLALLPLGGYVRMFLGEAPLTDDVYFRIGLVTLLGLAAKNAILIVEFAVYKSQEGMSAAAAALEAARLRFRPILMTSLAFILGVAPLAFSSGAGAGARHSVGTGVMGGMLAATFLAIFFVPLFYKIIVERKFSEPSTAEAIRSEAEHARALAMHKDAPAPGHHSLPPQQR